MAPRAFTSSAACTPTSPLLLRRNRRPLPELVLQHLAARVERQRVDHLDVARHLEIRHPLATPSGQLGRVDLLSGPEHHERVADLAHALVGYPHDRDLTDRRVIA